MIIGVQNHGDFIKTADDLISLLKRIDSPWCGAIVDTGYFKAAGSPLRMGRELTDRDGNPSGHVAIVNEELVRRHFAGKNPIGLRYGFGTSPDEIEIIGVVADAKYNDLRQESIPMAY